MLSFPVKFVQLDRLTAVKLCAPDLLMQGCEKKKMLVNITIYVFFANISIFQPFTWLNGVLRHS